MAVVTGEIRCHHCRREFDAGIFKGPDELSHMYRTGEMTIWISVVNYDDGQSLSLDIERPIPRIFLCHIHVIP